MFMVSAQTKWYLKKPKFSCCRKQRTLAFEGKMASEIVACNLHVHAMHAARQAFIKSESAEKLRRALRHQTRTYSDVKYFTGDIVYYKRNNSSEWKGPGTVIGQDGQQVIYPLLNKRQSKRIQIAQNKCIRYCLNLDNKAHIGTNEFLKINWLPPKKELNNAFAPTSLNFLIKCLLNTQLKYSTHPPQYTIHVEQHKS